MENLKMPDTIKRTIHYYELHATFNPEYTLNTSKHDTRLQALLSSIKKIVANKDAIRYQAIGDRMLFINDLIISPKPNKIIVKGKLLSVRKDFFPELLNTNTDQTRDILAAQEEGIVETTHFIIQEKKDNHSSKLKLAIEFNLYGAKIADLVFYLEKIGEIKGITKSIKFVPIVRNSLARMQRRIGEISKITLRLKKDNLSVLRDVDQGIWTALDAASNEFEQEYVTMEFKYDINEARETPTANSPRKAKTVVGKFLQSLLNKKENVDQYDKLEVIAEDSDKNNRLNAFDLLIDKVKDELYVERRDKSRTIVSTDMFSKMDDSWTNKRIL
jgi:hypothetical protein